ncbi:alpha/beta hydrolase family protein [Calidifontibacter terrae]
MDPLPAPPSTPADQTHSYGPDRDQVIDLYVADDSAGSVVLIHGGFWKPAYDRSHLAAMAESLRAGGLSVALIEYRRRSVDRWEPMRDDVLAAIDLAAAHLEGPLVVAGHSAGGHLAVWAAGHRAFHRAVSLSGVVDLRAADADHLGDDAARALLGDLADHPERWAEADPMLGQARCPVLLIHGTDDIDVPISQSRHYAATHDATLIEVPGCDHWPLITPGSPPFEVVRSRIRR